MEIDEKEVTIEHEATVSKVGEEQLFYLMSRGLSRQEAQRMIVQGFFETVIPEFLVAGLQEKIRLALNARIS